MLACLPRGRDCALARLGSPSRDRGPTPAWGKEPSFEGLRVLTPGKQPCCCASLTFSDCHERAGLLCRPCSVCISSGRGSETLEDAGADLGLG